MDGLASVTIRLAKLYARSARRRLDKTLQSLRLHEGYRVPQPADPCKLAYPHNAFTKLEDALKKPCARMHSKPI